MQVNTTAKKAITPRAFLLIVFVRLDCENKQVLQYISTSLSIKQQVTQSELGYPQPYSDIWKFIITIT